MPRNSKQWDAPSRPKVNSPNLNKSFTATLFILEQSFSQMKWFNMTITNFMMFLSHVYRVRNNFFFAPFFDGFTSGIAFFPMCDCEYVPSTHIWIYLYVKKHSPSMIDACFIGLSECFLSSYKITKYVCMPYRIGFFFSINWKFTCMPNSFISSRFAGFHFKISKKRKLGIQWMECFWFRRKKYTYSNAYLL